MKYIISEQSLTNLADAVRYKAGTTDLLTIGEMCSAIEGLNTTTESPYNFEIVGSATEPTNPSENMIWINTDTTIGEYQFSANKPTTRVDGSALTEGDVWIKTTNYSQVEINTVKKNGINIKLSSCYQYINGAWVYKKARIYQNGNWNDADITYLYSYGNQYEKITGGWVKDVGYSKSSNTIAYEADCITFTTPATTSTNNVVRTKNKFDLTHIKNIKFTVSCSNANRCIVFIMNENTAINGTDTMDAWIQSNSTETTTYILDVSSISGEYFIAVQVFSSEAMSFTVKIYEVEFEY